MHTQAQPERLKPITVALAGQPNVGKSTVFNLLTGLGQHVGNWPGKTVEKKVGAIRCQGQLIRLVDLPGTYSLTANSAEERIARDFVIRERPDVVVVIVNAAALEHNLYLVAELLALPAPLVVGLNMIDVAEQHGIHVEPQVLAAALGVPVVPLIASKNQGVRELMAAALYLTTTPGAEACAQKCAFCTAFTPHRPTIRAEHRPTLEAIRALVAGRVPPPYPEAWLALKLLEGDAEAAEVMRAAAPEAWEQIQAVLRQHEDAYLDIAGARYEWIERLSRAAIVRPRVSAITLTDRVDRAATHPLWGPALLLSVLAGVFWLTYAWALPVVDWLDVAVLEPFSTSLRQTLSAAPAWLSGLLIEGVLGGVGTVLLFIPILSVFFAVLGVLEDVGYLTRVAYVLDGWMHHLGLHGQSALPLFLGFGCNVPAVIGARVVDDRRARLLTMLLAPLVPCASRLAVVAFLAPAFFGSAATLVSWGLVAGNLALLAAVGRAVHQLIFKGERGLFIMEMPLYHRPSARTIGLYVWRNLLSFVQRAGTLIVFASAIVWLLAALPGDGQQPSLLAQAGHWLEPFGRPLGLGDWRLIVALLSGFVAKESTLATLAVVYETSGNLGLADQLAGTLTPAAALAFLVIQMTFIPCAATLATIRQETASWKWTAFSAGLQLAISFAAGWVVYQLAALVLG